MNPFQRLRRSRRSARKASHTANLRSARRSGFESLEPRQLLAVSPAGFGVLRGDSVDIAYLAAHEAGGFSVTGRFDGTGDFDPGPGKLELTNNAPAFTGRPDMVVARYDDQGAVLWARHIGHPDPSYWQIDAGVAVDRLGNTYVLGSFERELQLGSQTLTADGIDGFIAKLDPNGNYLWARSLRTSSSFIAPRDAEGLAVDDRDADPANWSVFVSGRFNGTATLGGQTLTTKGKDGVDAYVSKISASSGDFQWSRVIGGKDTQSPAALAVAKGSEPAVYVLGHYATEAKLGAITLSGGTGFLAKLNTGDGSVAWGKTVAAGGSVNGATTALAASPDGILIAGTLTGTADFDPGPGVVSLTSAGDTDATVLKLDPLGNLVWARRMGGAGRDIALGLDVDDTGRIFVAGSFVGAADFGGLTLASAGIDDGYLAELTSTGNFVGVHAVGDLVTGVGIDAAGAVYVAAPFYGSALDYFPTGDAATTSGGRNTALLKFSTHAPPIDPTPSIDALIASSDQIVVGAPLALSVLQVHDPNRQFHTVAFYRDNGDGVLNVDEDLLVGTDVDATSGWTATPTTSTFTPGLHRFFAQGLDSSGLVLDDAATTVEVVAVETVSYAAAGLPLAIPDGGTVRKTLTVPDAFTILDLDVGLSITHTSVWDLSITLIAPSGARVPLFNQTGGPADNFSGTVFDDEAAQAISSAAAPYTGRFRPIGSLGVLDGTDAAGVWTLEIADHRRKDKGTLTAWSLTFAREAAPTANSLGVQTSIDNAQLAAIAAAYDAAHAESVAATSFKLRRVRGV